MINDLEIQTTLKEDFYKGFSMLFDCYYKSLTICVFGIVKDLEQSEDIVQELLYNFIKTKRHQTIETGKLKRYLFKAVKNNALKHVTSQKERLSMEYIAEVINDESDEILFDNDVISEVRAQIELLPPRTKEVVIAITVDHKKYQEVADEMSISINTVKTMLKRGLTQVRNEVGDKRLIFFIFFVTRM